MFRRCITWVLGITGLVALLVLVGIGWLIYTIQSDLVPPSDPVGQKSIAAYATTESDGPVHPPALVKDFSWGSITEPPKSARPWTRLAARGWQVDLTHLSGWPAGGPQVNLEDSIGSIVYGETRVTGGKNLSIEVPKPRPGASDYIFAAFEFFVRDFINFPADHARLLSVVATKAISGDHASNPFNLGDTVTLDPGSTRVLTSSVDNGVLNWDAPPGDWLIIARQTR